MPSKIGDFAEKSASWKDCQLPTLGMCQGRQQPVSSVRSVSAPSAIQHALGKLKRIRHAAVELLQRFNHCIQVTTMIQNVCTK